MTARHATESQAKVSAGQGSVGVPCPVCGERRSAVVDTRPSKEHTRRRRVCANGHAFTTHERCVSEVWQPNYEI